MKLSTMKTMTSDNKISTAVIVSIWRKNLCQERKIYRVSDELLEKIILN
jgi:hypothetical protein